MYLHTAFNQTTQESEMSFPIHPPMVHFAIGLFSLSFVLDFLGLLNRNDKLHFTARINLYASVPAVLAAVVTGLIEKNRIFISPGAREAFEVHETLAFIISALVIILAMWRLNLKGLRWQKARTYYIILSFATLIIIFSSGYYGSQLVYRYGSGTSLPYHPPETVPEKLQKVPQSSETMFQAEPDTSGS
jgi:uncharacterized membrane protein